MPSQQELIRKARAMYERIGPHSVPAWDQLGDTTRGVWLERAGAEPDRANPKPKPKAKTKDKR